MTTVDCAAPVHGFHPEDCAPRCIACGSDRITSSDIGTVFCYACGAHEDDAGFYPAIDAFESFAAFYAPAYPFIPDEPPAALIWDPPARKPMQNPVRRRKSA